MVGRPEVEQTGEQTDRPDGRGDSIDEPLRPDEFPLAAFVKAGGEDGRGGVRDPPPPELVREELMHRFVTGKHRHVS